MAGGQRAEREQSRGKLLAYSADEGAQPERGHDQQLHFYVATVFLVSENKVGIRPV